MVINLANVVFVRVYTTDNASVETGGSFDRGAYPLSRHSWGGGLGGRNYVHSQGRFGRVLSSEAAVPSSSTRVVASCPSRIHAQLRNPGDPGDGYHDTATDGGDQQRHSQREGAHEAQVVNLHPRRVLQNEDDEHRQ